MVKTIVNTALQGECGEEIQIQIIFLLVSIGNHSATLNF